MALPPPSNSTNLSPQAQSLYSSSLLTLELTELLSSLQSTVVIPSPPSSSTTAPNASSKVSKSETLTQYLTLLRTSILNIPSIKLQSLILDTPDSNTSPVNIENIDLIGSYLNASVVLPLISPLSSSSENSITPPTVIDMTVQLPPSLMELYNDQPSNSSLYISPNYTNLKRKFLTLILNTLRQKKTRDSIGPISITSHNEGILLSPPPAKYAKKDGVRWIVRLLVTYDPVECSEYLPVLRLLPDRNNIKYKLIGNSDDSECVARAATPYYNMSVVRDGMHASVSAINFELYGTSSPSSSTSSAKNTETTQSTANISKASLLIKTHLLLTSSNLSSTHINVILSYLYRTNRINKRTEPVVILRVFFVFIEEVELTGRFDTSSSGKKGIADGKEGVDVLHKKDTNRESTMYLKPLSDAQRAVNKTILILPLSNTISPNVTLKVSATTLNLQPVEVTNMYRSCNCPVLLSSCLRFNYFWDVTYEEWEYERGKARGLLRILNDTADLSTVSSASSSSVSGGTSKVFKALFPTKGSGTLSMSSVINSTINVSVDPSLIDVSIVKSIVDASQGVSSIDAVRMYISEQIRRGLGNRVVGIVSFVGNKSDDDDDDDDDEEKGKIQLHKYLSKNNSVTVQPLKQSTAVNTNTNSKETDYTLPISIQSPGLKIDYKTGSLKSKTSNNTNITLNYSITLTPDASLNRLVDRGPLPSSAVDSLDFLDLFTSGLKGDICKNVGVRRFKDGEIRNAVVWDESADCSSSSSASSSGYTAYKSLPISLTVPERIIRHITRVHLCGGKWEGLDDVVAFSGRGGYGFIDGFVKSEKGSEKEKGGEKKRKTNASTSTSSGASKVDVIIFPDSLDNPNELHVQALKTFSSLQTHLQSLSVSLPLKIISLIPTSPSLRYTSLFPPTPHALLNGGMQWCVNGRASEVVSHAPIEAMIRLESSNKWPQDISGILASQTAILLKLHSLIKDSSGLESGVAALSSVGTDHILMAINGIAFRLMLQLPPLLTLLSLIPNPTQLELSLIKNCATKYNITPEHHNFIGNLTSKYPVAGGVIRMCVKWVDSHMLTGNISIEVVELLVAKVFTQMRTDGNDKSISSSNSDSEDTGVPASVISGFLKFLELVGDWDWSSNPMIVDPSNHLSNATSTIVQNFKASRGSSGSGPAMWMVSVYDRVEFESVGGVYNAFKPSFSEGVENVVLNRFVMLARAGEERVKRLLLGGGSYGWGEVFFEEKKALGMFNVLLKVENKLVLDKGSSSFASDVGESETNTGGNETPFTKSMQTRHIGPSSLSQKVYKNLASSTSNTLVKCLDFNPVNEYVQRIRERFGNMAVFFYNGSCPEYVGVLVRPSVMVSRGFSAVNSEFKKVFGGEGEVAINLGDFGDELKGMGGGVVGSYKVREV